jgi:hypothetical protein
MKLSLWLYPFFVLACGSPQSTFDFTASGSIGRVTDEAATGDVDDAGFLVIDDAAWNIQMGLGGLGVGAHTGTSVSLLDKQTGDLYTTSVAGTCNVTLDPHDSTNGSSVSGVFFCKGLEASSGAKVDIDSGEFLTYISDAANNPDESPPGP